MKQVHIFISGKVQGVGYRMFVRNQAQRFGLFGWVKNLADGRVEAVVQGNRVEIENLLEVCRVGPFLAQVEDVVVEWANVEEHFSEFRIVKE